MNGMLMPMRMRAMDDRATLLLVLGMWAVMMAAMMLPSAAPMILLYGTIARARRGERRRPSARVCSPPAMSWSGLHSAWRPSGFSSGLEQAALLSPMMEMTSTRAGRSGADRRRPLPMDATEAGLPPRCRSPLEFIMTQWREGVAGRLRHGAAARRLLPRLLLAADVAALRRWRHEPGWIAGLALFVLVEKLAPAGHWTGRAAGAGLVGWGVATLATAL